MSVHTMWRQGHLPPPCTKEPLLWAACERTLQTKCELTFGASNMFLRLAIPGTCRTLVLARHNGWQTLQACCVRKCRTIPMGSWQGTVRRAHCSLKLEAWNKKPERIYTLKVHASMFFKRGPELIKTRNSPHTDFSYMCMNKVVGNIIEDTGEAIGQSIDIQAVLPETNKQNGLMHRVRGPGNLFRNGILQNF